jgi:hypothetical protein
MDEKFCCRCKENFPVAVEPTFWRLGQMRQLRRAPKTIQKKFADWFDHDLGGFLCGNCYFDLTDV